MVIGAKERGRTLSGAIAWIGTGQFFLVQAVVQLAWPIPFSLMRNYISDLGNTDATSTVATIPRPSNRLNRLIQRLEEARTVACLEWRRPTRIEPGAA